MTMTLDELKKIVAQGESDTLELKKSTSLLPSASETTCAFLNGKGGIVLIGVTDAGKILGQNVTDHTRQEVANHIAKLEPPAQAKLDIEYVAIGDNKYVIVINIYAGNHKPYTYDGRAFMRNQTVTTRMSQQRYEQLIVERGHLNHKWDEQPAVGLDIKSLDAQEIRRTVQSGIHEGRIAVEVQKYSIKNILHYLELLYNEEITNAAVVLYAKKIPSLYSQCEIKMTRYRGNRKLDDFIDSKHFIGNAFKILSEANYFIMRHLPVASFFEPDKWKRIDKPALPVMAIREALINAVTHRDYTVHSASIALDIYNDRLELWNNGTLPSQLQLQDLKKQHSSFPRNKKIASVFRASGWVEKAGVGTVRMAEECRELGVPEPMFEQYSCGLSVTFKFKEPIGVSVTSKLPTHELNARQKAILEIIKKHETINIHEIISELENPPSQRAIQKDLAKLKNVGFINNLKKGKATVWYLL